MFSDRVSIRVKDKHEGTNDEASGAFGVPPSFCAFVVSGSHDSLGPELDSTSRARAAVLLHKGLHRSGRNALDELRRDDQIHAH